MPYKDKDKQREYQAAWHRKWSKTHRKEKEERKRKYRSTHKAQKNAANKRRHMRKYGILDDAHYDSILVGQGNRCASCGSTNPKHVSGRFSIDHDHNAPRGTHRALLCNDCNTILGYAHDQIAVLESCIAYLKKHNAKQDLLSEFENFTPRPEDELQPLQSQDIISLYRKLNA